MRLNIRCTHSGLSPQHQQLCPVETKIVGLGSVTKILRTVSGLAVQSQLPSWYSTAMHAHMVKHIDIAVDTV